MKLQIVAAKNGGLWAVQGVRTFFKQPLGLMGLLCLFMLAGFLVSQFFPSGVVMGFFLAPFTSLAMTIASARVLQGGLPMLDIVLEIFRSSKVQLRSLAVLGVLYTLGMLLIILPTIWLGGDAWERLLVDVQQFQANGKTPPPHIDPVLWRTLFVSIALQVLWSVVFWHAPALVHWHHIKPVKSLFFSIVAFWKNWRAYVLYGIVMSAFVLGTLSLYMLLLGLFGNAVVFLYYPVVLAISTVLGVSAYFSYRDCFTVPDGEPQAVPPQ